MYKISATSFYSLSKCERRVYMDMYGNPEEKGEYSSFVELLWEKGVRIENEIIQKVFKDKEITKVEGKADENTFRQTIELMKAGVPYIYQGVLISGDKIGRPDILEKVTGSSNLGAYHYIPCDIKSGRATSDKNGDDIKVHYANQILFYVELLGEIQGKKPIEGKILDIDSIETRFNVAEYEDDYIENKKIIETIVYKKNEPEPIISGTCKECVWTESCLRLAKVRQDPSLLFKLGKQKYQLREKGILTIEDLSKINVSDFLKPPNKMHNIGKERLTQWHRRANVWLNKRPILHAKPNIKKAKTEIYYDIEDDPSLDHVYLHGFIVVENGQQKEYESILATKREEEEIAARKLWEYISELSEDDVIYHYGSYEKTKTNRLREKYNLPEEVLQKFDRLRVDLYRVVETSSDWPVSSYGVKPIAKYLGFKWTSEDASGANSIAWYNEYIESPEKNKELLSKILIYNKEDCEAMIIVKNWLQKSTVL